MAEIFRFPDVEIKTTKDKPDTSETPVHPRVCFLSYEWETAKPNLESTKIEPGKQTSTTVLYLPSGFSEKLGAEWKVEDTSTALIDPSNGSAWAANAGEYAQKMAEKGGFGGITSAVRFGTGKTSFPGEFLVFEKGNPVTMDFTFDLLPRNDKEAKLIVKITENFKRKILPTYGGSAMDSFFLSFPDIWHIKFQGAKGIGYPEKQSVYEDMALTSVNVSYGGGANSALFFHDGHAVCTTLSLSFQSIKHSYISKAG